MPENGIHCYMLINVITRIKNISLKTRFNSKDEIFIILNT